MKLASIFKSLDMTIAVVTTITLICLLPARLPNAIVKDFYTTGISVLAIVYSLFLAALTLIASTSDDAFVVYLEKKGHYSVIMATFKFVSFALLLSLIYSVLAYFLTLYWIGIHYETQSRWWTIVFLAGFIYSLLATSAATHDCIQFGKYRARYLMLRQPDEEPDEFSNGSARNS
jgi:hypothetical protein